MAGPIKRFLSEIFVVPSEPAAMRIAGMPSLDVSRRAHKDHWPRKRGLFDPIGEHCKDCVGIMQDVEASVIALERFDEALLRVQRDDKPIMRAARTTGGMAFECQSVVLHHDPD